MSPSVSAVGLIGTSRYIMNMNVNVINKSRLSSNSQFHSNTSLNLPPNKHHLRRCSVYPIISASSADLFDIEAAKGQGVYPLHRCKTIHFVRHAQGFHNVAGEEDPNNFLSPEFFDAAVTPLGWQQIDNLREHAHSSGLSKKIQLVVVSPLLRAIQTGVGVFGGGGLDDVLPPLMTENAFESGRPPISSLNAPPFVANELCREHLGVAWCDKRRSITEYKPRFPAIDFSLIETDEDTLWQIDVRETNEELALRGLKFLTWLWTREETEIAVVSHSGFLFYTLALFGDDCHPSVKEEMSKPFQNCELRSLVLVDRRMIRASSPSKTDFPGKIPYGSDAPSAYGVVSSST